MPILSSPPPRVLNSICDGRLTLTTAVPVTTADVTGATSVYFTPYKGNRIALYDGSNWNIRTFSEITIALGTLTSGLPYDLFAYDSAGTVTFDAPLAWTNTTTRATALVLQNGVLSKSGAVTRRYIGTFYTTATTTTEDSETKRFLWNYYNRIDRKLLKRDATGGWTYTTAAYRQANAGATNQVEVVIGWVEDHVDLAVDIDAENSTGDVSFFCNIGVNSTTVGSADILLLGAAGAGLPNTTRASLRHIPAVGWTRYVWLEYSEAIGTTTWNSNNSRGIHGYVKS